MFGNLFISHTISPSLLPEAVLSALHFILCLDPPLFIRRPDPVSDLKGRIPGFYFRGSRQKAVIIKKAVLLHLPLFPFKEPEVSAQKANVLPFLSFTASAFPVKRTPSLSGSNQAVSVFPPEVMRISPLCCTRRR